MSTSGVSRSWTPGTERRYATTTAPSSTGRRLTRGMKAVLLLALLAILIVAIVPAAVVSTRDKKKQYRAEDRALGYTTVVDGITTFVQTRTASVVTRSSYSTLDNGVVSTILQAVTLPIITVSATSAGQVQQGFETVTLNGQEVIVATVTRFVAGANAFVTRTVQDDGPGVATVYRTVFDDLTVRSVYLQVHFVKDHRDERELYQLNDPRTGDDSLNLILVGANRLAFHLATCHHFLTFIVDLCARPVLIVDFLGSCRDVELEYAAAAAVVEQFFQQRDPRSADQHRSAAHRDEQQRTVDDVGEQLVSSSAAVELEQYELGHLVDLEQPGRAFSEQQHGAAVVLGQHDAASRFYDRHSDIVGPAEQLGNVAFVAGPVVKQELDRFHNPVDERVGRLPFLHDLATSRTFLDRDNFRHDKQPVLKRTYLVYLDCCGADDDRALHSRPAALPRRLQPRVADDNHSHNHHISLDQQLGRLAAEHDVAGVHPRAPGPPRRVRHQRVDKLLSSHHLKLLGIYVLLLGVDLLVVFLSPAADNHDRGVHPGLAAFPRRLRRGLDHLYVDYKHLLERKRIVKHAGADLEHEQHDLGNAYLHSGTAAHRRRLRPVRPDLDNVHHDPVEQLIRERDDEHYDDVLGRRHLPSYRPADLDVFLDFQRGGLDDGERHFNFHNLSRHQYDDLCLFLDRRHDDSDDIDRAEQLPKLGFDDERDRLYKHDVVLQHDREHVDADREQPVNYFALWLPEHLCRRRD